MGKGKVSRTAAKRFKITGRGKIMYKHSGKDHLNRKKSQKRLRRLSKLSVVPKEKRYLLSDLLNGIKKK